MRWRTYSAPSSLASQVLIACAMVAACDPPHHHTVLWHALQGAERDELVASVGRWNAAHPDRDVELVGVPHTAFADKLSSAIPRGNGPDLFIYPQDRIGDWADAGAIESLDFWLDDAALDHYAPQAVAAMTYRGQRWGLPLSLESLALFYRTDLVSEPPRTTDELRALAPAMHDHGGYPLAYTNDNLYGHAPWLFGFGGAVFDDREQLAVASSAAADAMVFAKRLVDDKITPARAEGPYVATLFNEGKAAMAISGPWFIADIARDVPWRVTTLPTVSDTGQPARPFLGAKGVIMSARAHDKLAAFAVMAFLASDGEATERARHTRAVVPNHAAYDDPEIARDSVLAAFRAQLAHTATMHQGPAMRMVWTPYQTALGEVLAGRAEPAAQLLALDRELRGYLR